MGDANANTIFVRVGAALTYWEMLESSLGELFDCLVSGATDDMKSNRSGIAAFTAVNSSSGRTQLIEAAVPRALKHSALLADATSLIAEVKEFGGRRNEIAHGRVVDTGEHGHYLAPNNTNPHKWHLKGQKAGAAKYQYMSSDIAYYAECFGALYLRCGDLIAAIHAERCGEYSKGGGAG